MIGLAREILHLIPRWVKWLTATMAFLGIVAVLYPYAVIAIGGMNTHIRSAEPSTIDRLRAGREYLRYAYRELTYSSAGDRVLPVKRQRGRFIGLDKTGIVHLELYTKEGRLVVNGRLADLDFTEPRQVHLHIREQIANKFVVVDTYLHLDANHYVIWLHDGTPINETLILANLAVPTSTPPTNIVNTMFKTHYLKIIQY